MEVYDGATDNRRRTEESVEELQARWAEVHQHAKGTVELETMHRDGLCHKAVMWFVHHSIA